MKKKRLFFAKVLLFGEYAIVLGGAGIAIPLQNYFGHFCHAQPNVRHAPHIVRSQEYLLDFATYWAKSKILPFVLDTDRLIQEVQGGRFFDSNIPQGYGLGSSGALVAAIYEDYVTNNTPTSLSELKSHLALLESYFHGQSSGIDPLISYLNCPLHLIANSEVQPIKLATSDPKNPPVLPTFFLYDTGIMRKTAPLVTWFMAQCRENSIFEQLCSSQLLLLNEACMNAFLRKDSILLKEKWKQLSIFQYDYLQKLIPANLLKQWQYGLQTDAYYLKLCGAGGGGFMLGLTENIEVTKMQLKGDKVLVFQPI